MDSIVHVVAKSQTRLSDFHFTVHFRSSCHSNDSLREIEACLDLAVESPLSLMELHRVVIVL